MIRKFSCQLKICCDQFLSFILKIIDFLAYIIEWIRVSSCVHVKKCDKGKLLGFDCLDKLPHPRANKQTLIRFESPFSDCFYI